MAEWAGAGRKGRTPSRSFGDAASRRSAAEVAVFRDSGDWASATPRHFVALHEDLHAEVYGVRSGMSSRERQLACFAASKALRDDFAGDPAAMAEYVRWAWLDRELGRERWRRENKRGGGRLGWSLLFGKAVGDYRLEVMRKGNRR